MGLNQNLVMVLIATVIAFSTLYVPQPMLPMLAQNFGISAGQSGLLMTVAMLPLALAPVLYGYYLQAIPARLMLMVTLLLLAVNQICVYFVDAFWHLLVLRGVQGLLLSAVFTALMTYCANMAPRGGIRLVMGCYIGATILGGFAGRLAGGFFASMFDWRMAFVMIGLAQFLALILLLRADADADVNFARLDAKRILRVLSQSNYQYMFIALAGVFFVFSGVLNLAPFHLRDIDTTATPFLIAILYVGYLIGVPVSFCSDAIGRRLGDERTALGIGLAVHGFGLIMLLFVAYQGLVIMMFFLAGGFFLVHSRLSGLANHLADDHKGVVNGLYVSIYYLSGALGSWLPGYIYDGLGWQAMIVIFGGILAISACSVIRLNIDCSASHARIH